MQLPPSCRVHEQGPGLVLPQAQRQDLQEGEPGAAAGTLDRARSCACPPLPCTPSQLPSPAMPACAPSLLTPPLTHSPLSCFASGGLCGRQRGHRVGGRQALQALGLPPPASHALSAPRRSRALCGQSPCALSQPEDSPPPPPPACAIAILASFPQSLPCFFGPKFSGGCSHPCTLLVPPAHCPVKHTGTPPPPQPHCIPVTTPAPYHCTPQHCP